MRIVGYATLSGPPDVGEVSIHQRRPSHQPDMKMGTLADIKVNDPSKAHIFMKHAGTGLPQNFAPKQFLEQRMSKIHEVGGGDSSRINQSDRSFGSPNNKRNAHQQNQMIDEIDSHSIVQFGEGQDWCLYMFGGYINNKFLSNRIFKI